jgi:hypothetical protein
MEGCCAESKNERVKSLDEMVKTSFCLFFYLLLFGSVAKSSSQYFVPLAFTKQNIPITIF